ALHREPCNEIGSLTLEELEKFVAALEELVRESHTLIIYSTLSCGFCAGADLRELYRRSQEMKKADAAQGVRNYLERIHRVMNTIDAAPLTTIAAVHGVVFGGGFRSEEHTSELKSHLKLVCRLMLEINQYQLISIQYFNDFICLNYF